MRRANWPLPSIGRAKLWMRKILLNCFGTPYVSQFKMPSGKDSMRQNLLRRLSHRFVIERPILHSSSRSEARRYLDTRGISERNLGLNTTKVISTTRRKPSNKTIEPTPFAAKPLRVPVAAQKNARLGAAHR